MTRAKSILRDLLERKKSAQGGVPILVCRGPLTLNDAHLAYLSILSAAQDRANPNAEGLYAGCPATIISQNDGHGRSIPH